MLIDGPLAESAEVKMRFHIFHAIDASIKKVTVGSICEKAAISRDTFYRYFTSKFDVIMWHGRFVQSLYLDQVGRSIDWYTGYLHNFRLLAEERDTYTHALLGMGYQSDEFFEMILHREETLLESLRQRGVEVDEHFEYTLRSYVLLETLLVTRWLVKGCEPAPELQARRMVALIPQQLFQALHMEEAPAH